MFTCLPVSRKSTTWLSASAPDLQRECGRARDPRFRSPVCYPVNRGPEILSEKTRNTRGTSCTPCHPARPRRAPPPFLHPHCTLPARSSPGGPLRRQIHCHGTTRLVKPPHFTARWPQSTTPVAQGLRNVRPARAQVRAGQQQADAAPRRHAARAHRGTEHAAHVQALLCVPVGGGGGLTGHHPLQYIQIILRNCNTNTKEGNSSRRDFTVLPILDTRDIKFKLATWAQRVDNVHFPQRENRTLFKWESSESESNAFLHHKRIN